MMSTTENQTVNGQALLAVDQLVKYFPVRGGILYRTIDHVRAVDKVSFSVRSGETFGLVGESGCGKTTVGRTVLALTTATDGKAYFEGKNIFAASTGELKQIRRQMQIIFQ